MIQMTQICVNGKMILRSTKTNKFPDFFPDFQRGLAAGFPQNGAFFEDDDNAVPFLKGANFQVMTPIAQIIQKTSRGCFRKKMAALCDPVRSLLQDEWGKNRGSPKMGDGWKLAG